MPTLTDDDIGDLTTTTLNNLGPNRFMQIAQDLQDYEVMGVWLKKDRVIFDSGIGIKRTLMTKRPGAARHTGRFEKDVINVTDLLEQLRVPWRSATTNWGWERRELLENRGRAMVVNLMKPRRAGAMIDLAEELEEKGWSSPGASNTLNPYGLPYWIVKNASTGFNGGHPSGHSSIAGIDTAVTPNFKNYTGTYTAVSKADLIKSMRTMHRKTKWKSPVSIKEYRGRTGRMKRYYVNETTISNIEDVGEAQNENLGRDIASMDDQIVFRKHPIVYVPYLDNDTQNPVYQVDHETFYPVILKGDYLRESKPAIAPNQHNTWVVHVDLSYNFICLDRRRNGVFYVA